MIFRLHAPFWYYLYSPFEFSLATFRQKFRHWRRRNQENKQDARDQENVQGKVVIITGANTGIGKHTATEIAKKGAVVIMGCRDLKRGEIARQEIMKESQTSSVELYQLDLGDLSSVRHFATEVLQTHPVIDILINNAGISVHSKQPNLTKEGWDLTMTTNHLGPFLLTNLLIDSISMSSIARVVTISSTACIPSTLDTKDLMMMSSGSNLGFLGTKPYENSKLANALFMKALAKRYPLVNAYSVCPGLVRTEIVRHFRQGTATGRMVKVGMFLLGLELEHGTETVLICSLGKQVDQKDSGGFFRFGKRLSGVENMLKEEVAEELWKVSGDLIRNFNTLIV